MSMSWMFWPNKTMASCLINSLVINSLDIFFSIFIPAVIFMNVELMCAPQIFSNHIQWLVRPNEFFGFGAFKSFLSAPHDAISAFFSLQFQSVSSKRSKKKKKKNSDSDFVLFLASFISPIERWHYFYTLISNLLSSMLICSLDVRNLLVLASFTWRRKKKHFDLSRLLWIISIDAMPPTSAFQKRDSYFYASTIYELVGADTHAHTQTSFTKIKLWMKFTANVRKYLL